MRIKKSDIIPLLVILLLPLTDFFTSSADELLAIFCGIYIIYSLCQEKVSKNERYLLAMIMVIVFIGLLSNVVNKIISNYFAILIDVLEFCKVFLVFIAFRIYFRNKDFREICKKIQDIAKTVIIISFICAVISQFTDIGMTMRHADGNIYKELGVINPFGFYSQNGIQTYYLISGCLLFILSADNTRNEKRLYTALYLTTNVLIGVTLVQVANVFFLSFMFYYRKNEQVKLWKILFLLLIVVAIAFPDIEEYILNQAAPRSVLLLYGIKTANMYFPIGSGFASYGGEMAARYYSPLYWNYGFNNRYGLSHDGYGGILNDNYVAMIVAQFGYFSLILFAVIYYRLFRMFDLKKVSVGIKPLIMSVFFTIGCSMMISANSKTLMGVWIYALLGMCSTSSFCNGRNVVETS